MAGAADVACKSFCRLVFRLDDNLHVLGQLHPFTLRWAGAFTLAVTKAAGAATKITIALGASGRGRAITPGT